jgi:hypothetical protein
MSNLVIGGIVALWGVAVLVNGLLLSPRESDGAYGAGRFAGIALGGVLAFLGGRTAIKALRER